MFSKKETSTSFSAGSTTLISKNTEVIGDIKFSGNLMIEGTVKGNIYVADGADAHARVLDNGFIEGEICVPTLVINGKVNGDVYSSKHIELAAKAVVNGNVHYSLIEMVKGAQVNGNLVYNKHSDSTKTPKVKSGHKANITEPLPAADVEVASATIK